MVGKQTDVGELGRSAIDEDSKQETAEGVASTVYRAKCSPHAAVKGINASFVAIKTATANKKFSPEPHDIVKEIAILSSISHANIIPLLHASLNRSTHRWEMITPWIPYSVDDLLNTPSFSPHECPPMLRHLILPLRIPSSSEDKEENTGKDSKSTPTAQSIFVLLTRSIIFQTSLAISFLHNHTPGPIAHRDIKPRNLLLTETGRVQLIDFGIAYEKQACTQKDILWPEVEDDMYSDVATGPYRAPELLFGARKYDACTSDLWSLGALIAQFFTPLLLTKKAPLYHSYLFSHQGDDEDDEDEDDLEDIEPINGYIISPRLKSQLQSILSFNVEWNRRTLFDASRGTIGLVWSIFKVFGTPTKESWPEFESLPDANTLQFMHTDGVPLRTRLPNSPPAEAAPSELVLASHENTSNPPIATEEPHFCAIDLVERLLVYSPAKRITITEVLNHPWLIGADALVLPVDHPGPGSLSNFDIEGREWRKEWSNEDLGFWVRVMFGKPGRSDSTSH